jgi:chorismate synthase
MSNTLGRSFTVTSYGESHGELIGTIIEGCPAGLPIDPTDIQQELAKRKPQSTQISTARSEDDRINILSGAFEGKSTGAPICLVVRNRDINSAQYEERRYLPRPGHADFTAFMKYGGFNDFRGGGQFSGRITAGFVMAGAIAKKVLGLINAEVVAHTLEIGGIKALIPDINEIKEAVNHNILRCADQQAAQVMIGAINEARDEADSLGGIIEGIALNIPVGLGEPVFDTLEGQMAKALFAIPAVKGVEFGSGFRAASLKGSQNNDPFISQNGKIATQTNNAGGILGGISTGMPIVVRVAIKPTPSISQTQNTVDLRTRQAATIQVTGRHDPCIVPRAVVVVESMMAITLCDFASRARLIPRVLS